VKSPPPAPHPPPDAARLLVVDDEAPLMAALRSTLRDEGYSVEGVTSGEEALLALRREPYDLLMVDLMMPRMDGIALLRLALAEHPHLAAMVMTGHGSVPTAVEAMKLGAIDYVLKPFKLGVLLPALERALTLRRLRLKNLELEQSVRARTAELEAVNRELEAFSFSVSHDLRTPLRAIAGFVELLRDYHAKALSPEVRHLIDLIHSGTGEMNQLISDLLGFARLGRQPIRRQRVELGTVFRAVFAELAGERAGRRVELRVGALPVVHGDPALLRLVVVNLLSNAIKYTRPRDVATIAVEAAPGAPGAGPVFSVRDNGVGFDMRDADKLFGVFSRLHHAHEFEGTGVGLATARSIIERHGGRIWAEAARSAGATFFFTVPPEAVPGG
jgi:signal transduction histidine kinase